MLQKRQLQEFTPEQLAAATFWQRTQSKKTVIVSGGGDAIPADQKSLVTAVRQHCRDEKGNVDKAQVEAFFREVMQGVQS